MYIHKTVQTFSESCSTRDVSETNKINFLFDFIF